MLYISTKKLKYSEKFDIVYSSYLHIDPIVNKDESVSMGDPVGTISSCCSHLHFEMKTDGIMANGCGGCGYCTSYQDLTNKHFIDPSKFIADHTNNWPSFR